MKENSWATEVKMSTKPFFVRSNKKRDWNVLMRFQNAMERNAWKLSISFICICPALLYICSVRKCVFIKFDAQRLSNSNMLVHFSEYLKCKINNKRHCTCEMLHISLGRWIDMNISYLKELKWIWYIPGLIPVFSNGPKFCQKWSLSARVTAQQ